MRDKSSFVGNILIEMGNMNNDVSDTIIANDVVNDINCHIVPRVM